MSERSCLSIIPIFCNGQNKKRWVTGERELLVHFARKSVWLPAKMVVTQDRDRFGPIKIYKEAHLGQKARRIIVTI